MNQIIQVRSILAEFMGAKIVGEWLDHVLYDFLIDSDEPSVDRKQYPGNSRFWASSTLKYDTSFEWLIPVFVKLKKVNGWSTKDLSDRCDDLLDVNEAYLFAVSEVEKIYNLKF